MKFKSYIGVTALLILITPSAIAGTTGEASSISTSNLIAQSDSNARAGHSYRSNYTSRYSVVQLRDKQLKARASANRYSMIRRAMMANPALALALKSRNQRSGI